MFNLFNAIVSNTDISVVKRPRDGSDSYCHEQCNFAADEQRNSAAGCASLSKYSLTHFRFHEATTNL
jgi:hypothetical protein